VIRTPTTGKGKVVVPGSSLATLASEAEDALDAAVVTGLKVGDPLDVVSAIHREIYGHKRGSGISRLRDNARKSILAAAAFCDEAGIDFALYAEAQINASQFAGFKTFNFLWIAATESAKQRYEQYLRASYSRFRHQGRNTLSNKYVGANTRKTLYADEYEAGKNLCIGGKPISLVEAHPSGSTLWKSVIDGSVSDDATLRYFRYARLAAQRDVADYFHPGLSEYIYATTSQVPWSALQSYLNAIRPAVTTRRPPPVVRSSHPSTTVIRGFHD